MQSKEKILATTTTPQTKYIDTNLSDQPSSPEKGATTTT